MKMSKTNAMKTSDKKQTYLDAPTIQAMLASLKQQVQISEAAMIHYKGQMNVYWLVSKGKFTMTDDYFTFFNEYRTFVKQERKKLASLVKQIKGLKAMLKDAV